MTETKAQLEAAALNEALTAYKAAVAIASRCRSLTAFLTGLHDEFPDVPRDEMGAEADTETLARFVDRQLLESMDTLIALTSVADRAPKQMMTWSKAAVDELRSARDALAPWRETAAA